MDFINIAETRQSCRSFDHMRPVESDKLNRCLHAARLAPSACNAQPYIMWVATGEKGKRISQARSMSMNKFIEDCSTFVIFSEDRYNISAKAGSAMKDQDFRSIDIGIACAYLTAEATECKLETCILGMFDEEKIKEVLGTKERIRLVVAIGYATEGYPIREKKRKDEDRIIRK
ncbi:MAG: nitroreductase family protein [Candidatus Methanomethylophilaceae archaeon]